MHELGFMYGSSPLSEVSALIGMFGFVHVSGLLLERQLIRAMMEMRAPSPSHSSGLFGH